MKKLSLGRSAALFLLLFALVLGGCCAAEHPRDIPPDAPSPVVDPAEEPGFPTSAEVRNPAVKGTRVSFKRLESEGVLLCAESGLGAMVLIRSAEELTMVKDSNVLDFSTKEAKQAFFALLSQKNLDVYQILIIGTPRNYNSGVCFGHRAVDELIIAENTGLVTAVYECEHTEHKGSLVIRFARYDALTNPDRHRVDGAKVRS